ncbi:hypothetical protein [Escherichia phage AV125]|nr:hypothetical protein [Escherichia phage AV125]
MIDELASQVIENYWREREAFIMRSLKEYFIGTVRMEDIVSRVEIHVWPDYEEWVDKENENVIILRIYKPEITLGGRSVKLRN